MAFMRAYICHDDETTGYQGYLSAPGYLDRTDIVVADTVGEVAKQLLDLYFDQPLEDMDADELEDVEWLTELAGLTEDLEQVRAVIDLRG